jgi:hypothetical protein
MQAILMTGSSGMLGRNAGEARNSDLMRKPEKHCVTKGSLSVTRSRSSAVFTIEQYGFVLFVILGRWMLQSSRW